MNVRVLQLNALEQRQERVLLEDILIFCTGTDRIPPGGFSSTPKIQFIHDFGETLATASTCDLTLRTPTCYHYNADKFDDKMILSLKGHIGFGRV